METVSWEFGAHQGRGACHRDGVDFGENLVVICPMSMTTAFTRRDSWLMLRSEDDASTGPRETNLAVVGVSGQGHLLQAGAKDEDGQQ